MLHSLVVLATQATTKVFKSNAKDEYVLQSFTLTVESNATLAFLPDPVTCFERAKYRQKQIFHLTADSNLVFVDWLTSGRKRNFISTGSVRDNRTEVNEHWDFSEYDNTAEIYVEGARLLTDRVRLAGTCMRRFCQEAKLSYQRSNDLTVVYNAMCRLAPT